MDKLARIQNDELTELQRLLQQAAEIPSDEPAQISGVTLPAPIICIVQNKDQALSIGAAEGQFYGANVPFGPADELFVVIEREEIPRLVFDQVGEGAKVMCKADPGCGYGHPYKYAKGIGTPDLTVNRDCSRCPHNAFHATKVEMEAPLETGEKCKKQVILSGYLCEDPSQISAETTIPFKLQNGQAMFASSYASYKSPDGYVSWPLMADMMKRARSGGKSAPIVWTKVLFSVRTEFFKFAVGSAYAPVFRPIAAEADAVYAPIKALSQTLKDRYALPEVDDATLAAVNAKAEYNPTHTGK